ncbi:hypothetical protein E2C01_064974 [Portunus trituberculatus]|uniref:Uncharacterized protein n=1 Tax=Portunus trituberculatus TaxID=210409 RepID=A0A5B7HEG7_PORTR|nr:hypothetical protein [Portunus trituberculatus]
MTLIQFVLGAGISAAQVRGVVSVLARVSVAGGLPSLSIGVILLICCYSLTSPVTWAVSCQSQHLHLIVTPRNYTFEFPLFFLTLQEVQRSRPQMVKCGPKMGSQLKIQLHARVII